MPNPEDAVRVLPQAPTPSGPNRMVDPGTPPVRASDMGPGMGGFPDPTAGPMSGQLPQESAGPFSAEQGYGATNDYGSFIPPYMGYLEAFKRQFPQAPAPVLSAAQNVWTVLNHLYSVGDPQNNASWHPVAYEYGFGEFVRDVAVASAARVGKAEQAETATSGQKPAPKPSESTTRKVV